MPGKTKGKWDSSDEESGNEGGTNPSPPPHKLKKIVSVSSLATDVAKLSDEDSHKKSSSTSKESVIEDDREGEAAIQQSSSSLSITADAENNTDANTTTDDNTTTSTTNTTTSTTTNTTTATPPPTTAATTTTVTITTTNNNNKTTNELENFLDSLIGTESSTKTQVAPVSKPKHNPLFDGCRSVDCYQRLSFIDQGTYGLVFRAKSLDTGKIYALKQVKLTNAETGKVGFPITALREINILLDLKHPNIVEVKEMVVGSSIDKVYMVMKYCENDLKQCMQMQKQSFSNSEIKRLMLQLLSATEYMHRKWYIHRDLKSSNLLYSNTGVLSVCDFGMARKYDSPIAAYTYEVVTLWYRAPELLLGSKIYSTPLDMWSVGCIMAEMLLGKPIFPGEGEIDQISKIFKIIGAPSEELWPGYSLLPNVSKVSWRVPSHGKLRSVFPLNSFSGGVCLNETGMDLLSKMLHMDPTQRISATEALRHPWLTTELPLATPIDRMPKFKSRHDD